ncbi:carboxypeptidase regulatory-like domain-containing protein [Actinoplanes sp. NPDC089786]|uniref:calcium-binding protein n=1 Tax=Actinoplanes sp. NPDC089786 TaxID=3155185 RepID=UPI003442EDBF
MRKRIILASGLTALSMLGLAAAPASAAPPANANGKRCTIIGTKGNDRLNGTSRADVICGLGGNDVLHGNGGNDVLDGGAGADTLLGGAGADVMLGGAGLDTVSYADHTSAVTVVLDGKAGDGAAGEQDTAGGDVENAVGGSGADTLTGNGGPNTLTGGNGNDSVSGGAGDDAVRGENGDDNLSGGAGNDYVDGGAGQDSCPRDTGDRQLSCTVALTVAPVVMATLSGRIADAGGQPVAGALVEIWSNTFGASAVSGTDGTFSLTARAGSYKIKLSNIPDYPAMLTSSVGLTVDRDLDITLPRSAQLTVHVTDPDGTPLAGAFVEAKPGSAPPTDGPLWSGGPAYSVMPWLHGGFTDAGGDLTVSTFTGVIPEVTGSYESDGRSYRGSLPAVEFDGDTDVSLTLTALPVVAPAPAPTATLSGHVVDADGQPVAGASIRVRDIWANTDTAGAFTVTAKAGQLGISIYLPGNQNNLYLVTWTDLSEDAEVTITLPRPSRLIVHVVDPQGTPVEGADVFTQDGVGGNAPLWPGGPGFDQLSGFSSAKTGVDGSATMWAYPGQVSGLQATHEIDGETATGGLAKVAVVGDTEVTLVVTPPAKVHLTGHVVDADGAPVAGVWVNGTTTDAAGAFALTVRRGHVDVDVVSPDRIDYYAPYWLRTATMLTEDTDVTIRLPRRVRLTVHVADPGGHPVAGATVVTNAPMNWRPSGTRTLWPGGPVYTYQTYAGSGVTDTDGTLTLWAYEGETVVVSATYTAGGVTSEGSVRAVMPAGGLEVTAAVGS